MEQQQQTQQDSGYIEKIVSLNRVAKVAGIRQLSPVHWQLCGVLRCMALGLIHTA